MTLQLSRLNRWSHIITLLELGLLEVYICLRDYFMELWKRKKPIILLKTILRLHIELHIGHEN